MVPKYRHALIVGAGAGLSASLARLFAAEGLRVSVAARSTDDLARLCAETGATAHECDAASPADVQALFETLAGDEPDVVVYNPSARERGPFTEIDPEGVKQALMVTAYGGFLVAQQAAKRMVPEGHGAILFTGASASVKGYAQSASFAMGKFALRGLAQSLARELHPKGIHIGHFVIDGGIRNPARPGRVDPPDNPDSMLDPDAIARAYWDVLRQDRSAWTWEVELRPWVENF
jgi:NAD(P)-dependent dehydrogenase (short-subunit alcohol dehydrogenase family)